MLAPIVEGHGEVNAVGVLVRRIALERHGVHVDVAQPWRLDSGKMRHSDELARAIRVHGTRVRDRGGVLVIRDGDDDDVACPVELRGQLTPSEIGVVPVEIVIAWREFEAWFLASVEALRPHASVRSDAESHPHPESMRDAKGEMTRRMLETYRPTRHQASFAALIDLDSAADNSRSFRRLLSSVEALLDT